MTNYCRTNPHFKISEEDIEKFAESAREQNRPDETLVFHRTEDPSLIRTQFVKNMIRLGRKLDLKLSLVGMLTGKAGEITNVHIDGTPEHRLPWRVCYYGKGEPALLSWFKDEKIVRVQDLEGGGGELPDGYTVATANTKVHTEYLDMHSAFIRTDIPHQLDMSECKEDRVTILAHFSPEISWDELMKRLDNLE